MTPATAFSRRLVLALGAAAAGAVALAGCGTPAPPPQLYQLPLQPPSDGGPAVAPRDGAGWEISRDVLLPAYLDRATMVVARGGAGLQLLEGHRWAEPLRDTVPRLLQHDLARLLGAGRIWPAPAPERVAVGRRLRVEILALQADAEAAAVVLQARWWLSDPQGRAAPEGGHADLRAPLRSTAAGDIAMAHRQVLWQLAQRIAAGA